MSPRRFEGWEPREFTEFVYGAEGRPVRTITSREPEWDAEDRAIIYALLDLQADQCPGCGQPMSESLHVDGREDPDYSASFAVCVGCVTRERAQKKRDELDTTIEKTGGHVWRAARRWVLRRSAGAHSL